MLTAVDESRRRLRSILLGLLGAPCFSKTMRGRLVRRLGVRAGAGVLLGSGVIFTEPAKVRIGAWSFLNHRCLLDDEVRIGAGVAVGPGCCFLAADHHVGGPAQRAGPMRFAPVTIGDGVWIGAHATILPGVTVGEGAVVAAGAVVTRDVAPNEVVAGVPARAIRRL